MYYTRMCLTIWGNMGKNLKKENWKLEILIIEKTRIRSILAPPVFRRLLVHNALLGHVPQGPTWPGRTVCYDNEISIFRSKLIIRGMPGVTNSKISKKSLIKIPSLKTILKSKKLSLKLSKNPRKNLKILKKTSRYRK